MLLLVRRPDSSRRPTLPRVDSEIAPVVGMTKHRGTILAENGPCPELRRVAYRSFDRKWVIPDARLHHRPSPSLWLTDSDKQIYAIEQHAHPVTAGPALVFAALIPDMDHFMGHHGGRVLPLYRNVEATIPNIAPGLLNLLADELAISVAPLDLLAYIAAVVAHSGFTRYFARDLRSSPGIRVPLTRQPQLWGDAVRVGRKVLWLHTYGERCVDVDAGRHPGPPKIQAGRPIVTVTIPDSESGMPDRISYDEKRRALLVGETNSLRA